MIAITTPTTSELSILEQLYTDAFPPEERRPWADVAAGCGSPALLSIHYGEATVGLISYWHFDGFVYVEHFAVDPSQRGSGIGSRVLDALRRLVACPVVLEVERPAPDNPMASRRIAFYMRNGFTVLDYDYIQPPYAPGLPEVPLLLMSTDPAVSPSTIAGTLHREVYRAL